MIQRTFNRHLAGPDFEGIELSADLCDAWGNSGQLTDVVNSSNGAIAGDPIRFANDGEVYAIGVLAHNL